MLTIYIHNTYLPDLKVIAIISVLVTVLLLVVIVLLITCWCCCKKSSPAHDVKMTPGQSAIYHIPDTNPNPAHGIVLAPHITYEECFTIKRNPSYGISAQPKRKRQLNDNYDYVVTDGEMIETDHNPSYVMTTVGNNELQDNPSYQPAFVAVI